MIKDTCVVKGDISVSIVCLMETVIGLTKSGAWNRLNIWRGTNKDLDWLFKPLFYRGKLLLKLEGKRQVDHDKNLHHFKKGDEVVTSVCVAETAEITITTAFHRCRTWAHDESDIDHLFRPVEYKKDNSKKGSKNKAETIPKRDKALPIEIKNEYETALRKHWGLPAKRLQD